MSGVTCIDLHHLGRPGAIGSYLLTGREPALVDPGPGPTLDTLLAGLREAGIGSRDLRHVVLTHVHLDHAGASGALLEHFPEAVLHVHQEGAPHMADPERLVRSTRRTFGDAHDRLWGEVVPVPADRIRPWAPGGALGVPGLRALSTPGHIAHHLAYIDETDGTLFSGDSLGIVLAPGAPTHPPTPPPAVDLPAWHRTLEELARVGAERFGAAHFGLHEGVRERARQLDEALEALEARVRRALTEEDDADAERFEEEVRSGLAPFLGRERVDEYFGTFPAATDWGGVKFYLERNP